jgi:hypothetical protein
MDIARGFGLDALVERRIEAAIARGELDNLPGAGRPMDLDDDPLVPDELRVAYRLLKNAGYVPPELAQWAEVNQLLGAVTRAEPSAGEDHAAGRRLRALLIQLELSGRGATAQLAWQQYSEAMRKRADRGASSRQGTNEAGVSSRAATSAST